jgi:gamma-glutamylcyclotransferase (GGCT)/AIG2-like uncharacterized protein YtfP
LTITAISTRDPAKAINKAMVMTEVVACTAIIRGQGSDMTELERSRVFVYGSLKRGQPNHHWLAGAPWLGEARLDSVELGVALTPSTPNGQHPLHGELYRVDGATLDRLDRLEGAPRLFERHWLPLSDGAKAWVYLGRAAQVRYAARIHSGHWDGPRLARWRRPESLA